MVPTGDTAPSPHFVLGSFSQGLPESHIWQLCPPASLWKHILKCPVMKYCHVSNLVSFSKQAILFRGLHNSASLSMIFFTDVSPPNTFPGGKAASSLPVRSGQTFAQVAKGIGLKVPLTQLCHCIVLDGVRACS